MGCAYRYEAFALLNSVLASLGGPRLQSLTKGRSFPGSPKHHFSHSRGLPYYGLYPVLRVEECRAGGRT
jgi:hypothetical protein